MKKGRISKEDEEFIKDNLSLSPDDLAKAVQRDPESVKEFIRRKVARGQFEPPWWLEEDDANTAEYNLISRPFWHEITQQFTDEELEIFKYHWVRIISQFKDDVIPTEELQVVDLIKMEILMNRALKSNKENIEQIRLIDQMISEERRKGLELADKEIIFSFERQIASLKASQESLNRDYRELQSKKNAMLKDMKATREQRVKRLEDSKNNFSSWMAHLMTNPSLSEKYGEEMEKMRLAAEKEKERLSSFHQYIDGTVDQPILTPDTVME